ncbi:MAG TPA: NAD(P)/FAD-dependent oxidoreductase [Pirellulaceae bacterium]|nr:NAD(P)/FAD-dependent oxidoreductase [Pirellulaceae bacterium]
MHDVAVIGGGISGVATAARLQAVGLSTIVLEAHGQPGGCAGFFRRRGFSFDVGATTLVDFSAGGIGGELLSTIGLRNLNAEELPGYVAWLPDRRVTLHRNSRLWHNERLAKLGDSPCHRRLWNLLDEIAAAFWNATRRGIRLPIQSCADLVWAAQALAPPAWPLLRFLRWTVGDLLRSLTLRDDKPLVGLLSMLLEDTVHASVDRAPLINGSLGITIRGAGLSRARGGMRGFWQSLAARYRALGGVLQVGSPVIGIRQIGTGKGRCGFDSQYVVHSRRGSVWARHVVCAVPAEITAQLAPEPVSRRLQPFLARDADCRGGALVLLLGVPEEEVSGQTMTHHQLLEAYNSPLGNGNNMFISVSSPGDELSAPEGHRAVMISTHCELAEWDGLDDAAYAEKKNLATAKLLALARRVYPNLGSRASVIELGTPRTYERFTKRPRGAVGGYRLHLGNSNQQAIPHRTPLKGFWLAGDTTWPGLGTVACVHGSRIVAEGILAADSSFCRPSVVPIREKQYVQSDHDRQPQPVR